MYKDFPDNICGRLQKSGKFVDVHYFNVLGRNSCRIEQEFPPPPISKPSGATVSQFMSTWKSPLSSELDISELFSCCYGD